MDSYAEKDRIAAACRGDLSAFNQIVLAYQDLLYNHACLLLGSEAAAEDVTQDAFLQAFQRLGQYRGGSFRAWLLRILINLCYDEIRRRERHPVQTFSALLSWLEEEDAEPLEWVPSPGPSVEEIVERQELRRTLQQHLDALPIEYRAVLVLVDVTGLNYVDAAEALNIPIGTVKSRLARARACLRSRLYHLSEDLPFAPVPQKFSPLSLQFPLHPAQVD